MVWYKFIPVWGKVYCFRLDIGRHSSVNVDKFLAHYTASRTRTSQSPLFELLLYVLMVFIGKCHLHIYSVYNIH
jgi:hypothetical protein